MHEVRLRSGVWYDDREITLHFPDSWNVLTYWPDTPNPLTDQEIKKIINSPVDQPPLQLLLKGKMRPIIIVDDLARPTPVFRILPFIIEQFHIAGISSSNIRIIVATGTHGKQNEKALANKIGNEAIESCRILVHDDKKNTRLIGKTSFGTSVYVNKELLNSDLVIGIGGIYPQHTAGFGGGSKLAIGVLGSKSIMQLHYRNKGAGGLYNINNDFRRDVTEIARMIGLNTIYSLHINAKMELVNLICGNHFNYYSQAAEYSRKRYAAPPPKDADVVIANSYPFDISFTFMRKAYKPLDLAPRNATKIIIATNYEGIGQHGLFQHMKPPLLYRYKALYRRISLLEPDIILSKILRRLSLKKQKSTNIIKENYATPQNSEHLWLYRPDNISAPTIKIEGIDIIETWKEILKIIEREQEHKEAIKVIIYPCAPIQCLDAQLTSK